MPTENEVRVLRLLSAIEIPTNAGQTIEGWGTEAVTVACDAAMSNYPGLRAKVRMNAVSVIGWMSHIQAKECIKILIKDSSPDVAIRAMRAAGRQKSEEVVEDLSSLLDSAAPSDILAAEALKALASIASPTAQISVQSYLVASPTALPHRGSELVQAVIQRLGLQP